MNMVIEILGFHRITLFMLTLRFIYHCIILKFWQNNLEFLQFPSSPSWTNNCVLIKMLKSCVCFSMLFLQWKIKGLDPQNIYKMQRHSCDFAVHLICLLPV